MAAVMPLLLLLACATAAAAMAPECEDKNVYHRQPDGTCTYLRAKTYAKGAAHTPLARLVAPEESTAPGWREGAPQPDGPNPRIVSNVVANDGEEITSGVFTNMVWQMGQFVDHDIGITEGDAAEPSNIELDEVCEQDPDSADDMACPAGQPAGRVIPFSRSEHEFDATTGNREQINGITHFVDCSMVYGSSEEELGALRDEVRPWRMRVMEIDGADYLPAVDSGFASARRRHMRLRRLNQRREQGQLEQVCTEPCRSDDLLHRLRSPACLAGTDTNTQTLKCPATDEATDTASRFAASPQSRSCPDCPGVDSLQFVAGDVRVNEQPGLTALHTLFVREHNDIADELALRLGTPDPKARNYDEEVEHLFQAARESTCARIQTVLFEGSDSWLRALLGQSAVDKGGKYYDDQGMKRYEGYKPTGVEAPKPKDGKKRAYNAQVYGEIFNSFAHGLFRFGHSMVPSVLPVRSIHNGTFGAGIELENAFFRPTANVVANGIEPLLYGLASSRANAIDSTLTNVLRNFLFRALPDAPGANLPFGMDLLSLNIKRGRDHGLESFAQLAEALGMDYKSLEAPDDPAVREALHKLYCEGVHDDVSEVECFKKYVDLFFCVAEPSSDGYEVPRLLAEFLNFQFYALRSADRFYVLADAYNAYKLRRKLGVDEADKQEAEAAPQLAAALTGTPMRLPIGRSFGGIHPSLTEACNAAGGTLDADAVLGAESRSVVDINAVCRPGRGLYGEKKLMYASKFCHALCKGTRNCVGWTVDAQMLDVSTSACGPSGCSQTDSSRQLLCKTFDFATVKNNGYEPAAELRYQIREMMEGFEIGSVSGGVGQLLRHTVSYGKYPLITLMDDGTARELYTNYAYLDMASIVDSTFTGLLRRHIKKANGGRAKVCLPANAFLDRGREVCA